MEGMKTVRLFNNSVWCFGSWKSLCLVTHQKGLKWHGYLEVVHFDVFIRLKD